MRLRVRVRAEGDIMPNILVGRNIRVGGGGRNMRARFSYPTIVMFCIIFAPTPTTTCTLILVGIDVTQNMYSPHTYPLICFA